MHSARSYGTSFLVGCAGSALHSTLMFAKQSLGILPTFDPYHRLQAAIAGWLGQLATPTTTWLISFMSGATVLGLLFRFVYPRLSLKTALGRGMAFGAIAWGVLGLVLFPFSKIGFFGMGTEAGIFPAFFSLVMMLIYGTAMSGLFTYLSGAGNGWSRHSGRTP
jgi:hypothetical protein